MGNWFYFGLLSLMGYGIGPLLAKKLTQRVTPLQGVFLTNLAVVATCAVAAIAEAPLRMPVPLAWGILILGGMTGAIAILSFFKGIETGQVAIVAPVANSFPIVTWGLTLIFLRPQFSVLSFLGTLIVVAGVIVLVYQRQPGYRWNRSGLYGVVTALGWGAHAFFIYLLLNTGLHPLATGFYLEGTILVWLAVFLIVKRDSRLAVEHLWPFGLLCGVVTALGALGYTLAVSAGGHPELVATVVGANPVLTCILVMLLFNEKLNWQQVTGIAITIVGLVALRFLPMLQTNQIEAIRNLARSDDSRLAETLDRAVIQIPAGDFTMGSDTERDDERPQRSVYLDAFEIDRYEVTNAQYRRFVLATGRESMPYWSGDNYPAGQADYPVIGVSWDDANSYCTWAGKRLPTEAEWEKACRGTDGRIYPWGNTWDPLRANVDVSDYPMLAAGDNKPGPTTWDIAWQLLQVTPASREKPGLRPVGSYPDGASPYGVMDMVGNASEWVLDWYNWSDYSAMPTRNPIGLEPPWNHCLRGSPWHDPVGTAAWVQTMSRCSARSSSHANQGHIDPRLGFRCAHLLSPATP